MGVIDRKRPRESRGTVHKSSLATPEYLASISAQLGVLGTRMEQLEHRHNRIVLFLNQTYPNVPEELQGEIIGVNPLLRLATPVSLASVSEQLGALSTRMERLEEKLNRIFDFLRENNFDIPQELLG